MNNKNSTFADISVIFINCTLTKSPKSSHTETLIKKSQEIMDRQFVKTEIIRSIDYNIASGVYGDMREHGWEKDDWPDIYNKVMSTDILVLAGPIWLGDNSSEMKKVIERLYGNSTMLNAFGQYAYYGKVGGCLITGNEDGLKHCAMNVLYSLQHIGYTIPPQADAGWVGEIGPGESYGDILRAGNDKGLRAGFDNDFTNRNITFMTWNMLHISRMLKDNGGVNPYGNQRKAWDNRIRFNI